MFGEQQHTEELCVTVRMTHNVWGLERNWMFVFVCERTCYQCLTGGRLWLLFSGTVGETNDISTPKGTGEADMFEKRRHNYAEHVCVGMEEKMGPEQTQNTHEQRNYSLRDTV